MWTIIPAGSVCTAKLGDYERFDKEQIGTFLVTNY